MSLERKQKWYKESLTARAQVLESAKTLWSMDQSEAESIIKRMAYSLKGLGTSFGFPVISQKAAILENSEGPDSVAILDDLLNTLYSVIDNEEEGIFEKNGVLIVNADSETRSFLNEKLSPSTRNLIFVSNSEEALKELEHHKINLILLNLVLPDIDGRNFLLYLKEASSYHDIPVIVLSDKQGIETKTECFALGADAYFEKPFYPEMVAASAASLLHKRGAIFYNLHKDPLTQLLNRTAFIDAFHQFRAYAKRTNQPLSVGLIDLDNFKSINDRFGHAIGDQVLVKAANIFTKTLRHSDIVARWGGEEFVFLFPNTAEKDAKYVLEKVLTLLNGWEFLNRKNESFYVSFSAGVILITDDAIEKSITRADILLYQAKMAGKCRVFSSEDKNKNCSPVKIMLVENDEYIPFVRHHLNTAGFETIHFYDGVSALNSAQKECFNLILLDLQVPLLNGFEFLKRIRRIKHYEEVPIVILAPMGDKKNIIKGMKQGANGYLVKPFSPGYMLSRIQRLLRNKSFIE